MQISVFLIYPLGCHLFPFYSTGIVPPAFSPSHKYLFRYLEYFLPTPYHAASTISLLNLPLQVLVRLQLLVGRFLPNQA